MANNDVFFVWMPGIKGPKPEKHYTKLTDGNGKDRSKPLINHVLPPNEYTWSLDMLIAKYPAPIMPDQKLPGQESVKL